MAACSFIRYPTTKYSNGFYEILSGGEKGKMVKHPSTFFFFFFPPILLFSLFYFLFSSQPDFKTEQADLISPCLGCPGDRNCTEPRINVHGNCTF